MPSQPQLPITRIVLDTLVVDACIRQEHSDESEVTEHPVEQGADPADHVRLKPTIVNFDCIHSSTPLGSTASVPLGLSTRVREAYAFLLKAREEARLIPVTTSLRAYTNMEITSLRVTKESKTGDALAFTCSLKQIRIVQNLIEKPTADLRAKGATNLGKKQGEVKVDENASLLFDTADTLTGGAFRRLPR